MNDVELHASAARHFAEGRYEEAFNLYELLARKGYAECQMHVGYMLHEGLGVKANPRRALEHFRDAAKPENPKAVFYLGRALTAAGKHEEAIDWYRLGAERGYAPAMFRLGLSLVEGRGIERDLAGGYSYLDAAARRGNVFAAREIAVRMLKGELGLAQVPKGLFRYANAILAIWRAARKDVYADTLLR